MLSSVHLSFISHYPRDVLLISEAVSVKNDLGMLPLRVAIRNKAPTPIIMDLIVADPTVVQTFGISGKTVLHLACMYRCDLTVVDRILGTYVSIVKSRMIFLDTGPTNLIFNQPRYLARSCSMERSRWMASLAFGLSLQRYRRCHCIHS
jgi:hypothetical protein